MRWVPQAQTTVEPLLQDASQLVSLVQPAIGGVASKAAQTLDVLAQMKINQVPQVGGYAWGVSKVTTVSESCGLPRRQVDPAEADVPRARWPDHWKLLRRLTDVRQPNLSVM